MQKHSQHNNNERIHFIRNGCERVMCERWVGNRTNCNILTPSSFVFSSTSFAFCWLLNRGSWGPIDLCCVLVLSTASYLQLDWLQLLEPPVAPGYIIFWRRPASCALHICTQFNPSTVKGYTLMHLFLDWRLGRRSLCYISFCSLSPDTSPL